MLQPNLTPLLLWGRFVDSIFELVDIWTETTEESEYLEMLDLLTQGITKVRHETDGEPVLRDDPQNSASPRPLHLLGML